MSSWVVESDGIKHTVDIKTGFRSKITVDNEVIKVKSSSSIVNLVDYSIDFGEKKCHLVMLGRKADLAVDGVFLDSKEPYKPLTGVPKVSIIFAGISIIGGFILSGLLGLCIGAIFMQSYLQSGIENKIKKTTICFIVCTVLQILVGFAVASMITPSYRY